MVNRMSIILSSLLIVLLAVLSTSVRAGLQTGVDAYYKGDFAKALKELRPLAESGDAKAQYQWRNINWVWHMRRDRVSRLTCCRRING